MDWHDDLTLDFALLCFFDLKYYEGAPADDCSKTIAALLSFMWLLSRHGPDHLPRAHRSMKALSKIAPSFQRLPLPWVFLFAIRGRFLRTGGIMMALDLFLQPATYMRPGEIAHLTLDQLVSPIRAA
eukprot:12622209-Heterocapsa_arctica.AAC.1